MDLCDLPHLEVLLVRLEDRCLDAVELLLRRYTLLQLHAAGSGIERIRSKWMKRDTKNIKEKKRSEWDEGIGEDRAKVRTDAGKKREEANHCFVGGVLACSYSRRPRELESESLQ